MYRNVINQQNVTPIQVTQMWYKWNKHCALPDDMSYMLTSSTGWSIVDVNWDRKLMMGNWADHRYQSGFRSLWQLSWMVGLHDDWLFLQSLVLTSGYTRCTLQRQKEWARLWLTLNFKKEDTYSWIQWNMWWETVDIAKSTYIGAISSGRCIWLYLIEQLLQEGGLSIGDWYLARESLGSGLIYRMRIVFMTKSWREHFLPYTRILKTSLKIINSQNKM